MIRLISLQGLLCTHAFDTNPLVWWHDAVTGSFFPPHTQLHSLQISNRHETKKNEEEIRKKRWTFQLWIQNFTQIHQLTYSNVSAIKWENVQSVLSLYTNTQYQSRPGHAPSFIMNEGPGSGTSLLSYSGFTVSEPSWLTGGHPTAVSEEAQS